MSAISGAGSTRDFTPIEPEEDVAAPAAAASVPAPPRDPKVEALVRAFKSEPADRLEKTLIAAKKENPVLYRTALREYFKDIGFAKSKLTAHNMAMDADNDGWLSFSEGYETMHAMGFHPARAFFLSALTSTLLASQTNDEFKLKLNVANSERAERTFFRTGFDTKEKLEERLDEVMAEDLDKDGYLTQKDFDRLVDKRTAKMTSKVGAALVNKLNKSEWQGLLQQLEGNKINRDELRDFYNSSLFFSFLEPDNLAKKLVKYRTP